MNRRRWWIVALLFLATTINYIDRQTLSVLGPTLRQQLHLSESDYANIVTAFLVPYTIMYSGGGRLIDYLGARVGLALSLGWWSIATMLTGLARSAFSLGAYRALLGIAEPCVFPAGIKTCTDLFAPKQRALPIGIFSSGSAVGAVVAPPLVAWFTLQFGWRTAFLVPGLLGICWLPFWLLAHRGEGEAAARHAPAARTPWRELLKRRTVWGLVLARFASDPVWYFYLFWLPDYLQRARHLSLREIAIYGWIPFLFGDFGGISGGAISDWFIRRGVAAANARLWSLLAVACIAPVGAIVGFAPSLASAIAVTCLVAYITQSWSTNTVALASDVVPGEAVGTVTGMMGTAGSLGGALFAQLLGILIAGFGYRSAFIAAALLHPIAIATLLTFLRPWRKTANALPGV